MLFMQKSQYPIFEWGKRKSEKRASSFRVGMAEDNLNKVMDQVELEIGVARKARHKQWNGFV